MAKPRTAEEEKRVCLTIARHYLNGEGAVVTAGSLARFLFEQRDAARKFSASVQNHDLTYDEIFIYDNEDGSDV